VNLLGASPDLVKEREAERRAYEEAGLRSGALWESLRQTDSLLRIAATPLLLSLITLVHYHRVTDLPKGRAALYAKCVEILVDLWDRQDKRLQLSTVASLKEKEMILRTIAFHYLKEDLLEASVPALIGLIEPLAPRLQTSIAADVLLRQIWERSGILQEQRLGFFGFAHRALHDYLAAAHVVEHELDARLLERAGEERWREVILLAAGLAPAGRAERLIEALLARAGESGAELEMAGLTLAEDVQLGDDLRAEVKKRLLDRLTSTDAAGPFRRLAGALMAADLEAARRWMEEELRGRDPQRQKRVLEMIPELGEAQARPMATLLVRLIGDGAADAGARARAAWALAGIRFSPDEETWRALESARHGAQALKNAAVWAWCELGRCEELGLVKVPAGEFLMGKEPCQSLYLPAYYIGRGPVTVGSFRKFLSESGYRIDREEVFDGWNKNAEHPAVLVSWSDALAFAEWHGFGLPSEAEWEKAARGTDGREYPWGNEWRNGLANTEGYWTAGGGRLLPWRRRSRTAQTTPVGQFSPQGDSPYGCVDMAGNVQEWTRNLDRDYPYDPADGRESREAPEGAPRVLRGGACYSAASFVRCAARNRYGPADRLRYVGFRVVLLPFSSDL